MQTFHLHARLIKLDERSQTVTGIATREEIDNDGEACDFDSSWPWFQSWSDEAYHRSGGLSRGNVREMHSPKAVGKVMSLVGNPAEKSISITAKITNSETWNAVKSGVLTGFSIGGKYLKKWSATVGGKQCMKYTAQPSEISLVDSPCLGSAILTIAKVNGAVEMTTNKDLRKAAADEWSANAARASDEAFDTDDIDLHQTAAQAHAKAAEEQLAAGNPKRAMEHLNCAQDHMDKKPKAEKAHGAQTGYTPQPTAAQRQSDAVLKAVRAAHAAGTQRESVPRSAAAEFSQVTPLGGDMREQVAKSIYAINRTQGNPLEKLFGGGNPLLHAARHHNAGLSKAYSGMLSKAVSMPTQQDDGNGAQVYASTGGTRPGPSDAGTVPVIRPFKAGSPGFEAQRSVRNPFVAADASTVTESGDQLAAFKAIFAQPPKQYLR